MSIESIDDAAEFFTSHDTDIPKLEYPVIRIDIGATISFKRSSLSALLSQAGNTKANIMGSPIKKDFIFTIILNSLPDSPTERMQPRQI